MKCWKVETIDPNGIKRIDYYSLLWFALQMAYIWEHQLNCKCYLKYGDWK